MSGDVFLDVDWSVLIIEVTELLNLVLGAHNFDFKNV